jgi:GUN4-like/Caspase domain
MANNWAIVVGVNDYDFLPEASLRFAVNDALAMKAWLCDQAGFPETQVLLCGDGSSGTRKATRPILRDILLHQLQKAQNADNLWFFFSGHGLGEHLMPIDGNPNDLKDTAISIHFVTEQLRACKAKNIVLVLDMCRNEHHEVGQKNAVSVADSLKKLVQDREGQQGIITLFSCGRGESSYEIASLEQGAFTYALLEGLKQQTIWKELETYLARRVPELHSVSGKTRKQVPLVIPEPGWKYDEPILSHYAPVVNRVGRKLTPYGIQRLEEALKARFDAIPADRRVADICSLDRETVRKIRNGQGFAKLSLIVRLFDALDLDLSPEDYTRVQNPSTHQSLLDAVPLESEKGVDYRKLRDLLKAGKWEEADRETLAVMLQAAHRKSQGLTGDAAATNIDWVNANWASEAVDVAAIWASEAVDVAASDGAPAESDATNSLIYFQYYLDENAEGQTDEVPATYVTPWRQPFLFKRQSAIDQPAIHRPAIHRPPMGVLIEAGVLKQFPCKDLRTIDQLWILASNGHFGFSVQKKIWEECGSPMSSGQDWDRFCTRVGWQDSAATAYVKYSDLKKNPSISFSGELPVVGVWGGYVDSRGVEGVLFSRTETCDL